jgi:stringent starvation protein B
MTPLKPYLIRSLYDWLVDNQMTPYLMVDADYPNTEIPRDFVEDGRIILNIRPEAIQGLILGNSDIQFDARFSGKSMRVFVPCPAVLAIYAKENGRGMFFDPEDIEEEEDTPPPPPPKPTLRVVK